LIVLAVVGLAVIIWVNVVRVARADLRLRRPCLLVFAVAAVKLGPNWHAVGSGLIPHVSHNSKLLYAYSRSGCSARR